MIRRATRVGLELLAAAAAAIVVLVAFLLWRLDQGPIRVNFLTPYVEQALNESGLGVRVEVDETVFAWSGLSDALDLRALHVRVFGGEDRQIAVIPEVGVRFSGRALLSQRVVPSRIALIRPRLLLVRNPEGGFGLALETEGVGGEASSPEQASDSFVDHLIHAIRRPTDPAEPATALNRLRITDALVTVDDRMLGTRWHMRGADLILSRERDGITGWGRMSLAVGQELASVSADLDFTAATGQLYLNGSLSGFEPTMLAEIVPSLSPTTSLSAVIGGTFDVTLDSRFQPIAASVQLSSKGGSIHLPEMFPAPIAFTRAELNAHYGREPERLTLDRLALDLSGPELVVTGAAARAGDTVEVAVQANATNVTVDSLKLYWPLTAAAGGRRWVTQNLSDGIVQTATARLVGKAWLANLGAFALSSLDGDIQFSGVTAEYFRPLPKITKASGSAKFDASKMVVVVKNARLRDIDLGPADIAITGFDISDERIAIDVPIKGPLQTAMTILDYPPLRYAQDLGIDPKKVQGDAAARASFAFPLLEQLTFDQIKISTVAELHDVVIRQAMGDYDVTEGKLKLALDRAGMTLTGDAKLAGLPVALNWREAFLKSAAERSRIRFKTTASDADRERLGVALAPYVAGPVAAEGVVVVRQNRDTTITTNVNLTAATLRVPEIGFEKPDRVPASAFAVLDIRKDRLVRVPEFRLQSQGLAIAGSADFSHQTRLAGLKFQQLAIGETDVRGQLWPLQNGGYRVEIAGPRLDLRPLLDSKPGKLQPAKEPQLPPLDIALALDEAILRDGVTVAGLRGGIENDGQRWTRIQLDAKLADAPVAIRYLPQQGGQSLRVETADAGAVLRGLQVTDDVIGGNLVLTGASAADNGPWPLSGTIAMSKYRLVRAPAIARMLNALGPTGFRALMTGEGITFNRLSAGFTADPGQVRLRDGRTAGGSLGLTFGGMVDLAAQRIDVEGTIVPIYTLNRMLGAIPLLGDLLTGGEGQGLFAATYRVRGPLADPAVTVNPLAVLAPGFLRNLFFLDGPPDARGSRQDQREPLAQGGN